MQVDTRVFCPVPTCPCADPLRARGWRSVHTMQSHIDAHMAGSISGDVPAAWLAQHNRQRCAVCGLSVACRFGILSTCRPEARAAMAGHMQDTEPGTDSLPSILEIHGSNTPTLRRVPHAARHSWSKALTRALALAHHHNTEAAWKQLLMLPQAVLDAPPRGGKKHHKALAAYTLDRLARWHEGERMALWTSNCSCCPKQSWMRHRAGAKNITRPSRPTHWTAWPDGTKGSGWLCGPAGTLHPNPGARAVLRNSGGNLPQG